MQVNEVLVPVSCALCIMGVTDEKDKPLTHIDAFTHSVNLRPKGKKLFLRSDITVSKVYKYLTSLAEAPLPSDLQQEYSNLHARVEPCEGFNSSEK